MKKITRRDFLRLSGATFIALAGGTVWRAIDQGVFATGAGDAYQAWEQWQAETASGSLALVHAAILAANPHNTQPWLFGVTETSIDLFADTTRNIGAIDPFLREMHIGLGCALENLLIAAPASGYAPVLSLLPSKEQIAHVELIPSDSAIPKLYHAIPERRTNRGAYETTPLSEDVLTELDYLNTDADVRVFWLTSDIERKKIADLTYDAAVAITQDEEQSRDSAAWFRHDWDELQQRADGVTIDAQAMPAVMRAITKMMPPLSQEQNDQFWLDATRAALDATPAFGILAVPNNKDNAQRIKGGQLYQRMNLWAAQNGYAMHPVNYASERADREESQGLAPEFGDALQNLIGDSAWQALMPFRIGIPTVDVLRSPRRGVEDVLI